MDTMYVQTDSVNSFACLYNLDIDRVVYPQIGSGRKNSPTFNSQRSLSQIDRVENVKKGQKQSTRSQNTDERATVSNNKHVFRV